MSDEENMDQEMQEIQEAIQDLQSAAATLRLVAAIIINGYNEGKVDKSVMEEVTFALDMGMGEIDDEGKST